jgi:hypothetical protein
MAKEIFHLLCVQLGIERDRRGSRNHDSQVGNAPLRPVFRKESDAIPRGDLELEEESREATRLIFDVAVSPSYVLAVSLDLESDPVPKEGYRLKKLDGDCLGC